MGNFYLSHVAYVTVNFKVISNLSQAGLILIESE